eukprot:1158580-Pelagomonas_calceolata.AAC.20
MRLALWQPSYSMSAFSHPRPPSAREHIFASLEKTARWQQHLLSWCTGIVREYVPASESGEMTASQTAEMQKDLESKRVAMEAWCRTAYGQPKLGLLYIEASVY